MYMIKITTVASGVVLVNVDHIVTIEQSGDDVIIRTIQGELCAEDTTLKDFVAYTKLDDARIEV